MKLEVSIHTDGSELWRENWLENLYQLQLQKGQSTYQTQCTLI